MPNRCSMCRQCGHNRTRCPHDAATATSLREEYNRAQRQEVAQRRRELNERLAQQTRSGEEFHASMYAQVVDMERRLQELTNTTSSLPVPSGPTIREQKVQEILFEHCREIPEGLYKELMDALVLRG